MIALTKNQLNIIFFDYVNLAFSYLLLASTPQPQQIAVVCKNYDYNKS